MTNLDEDTEARFARWKRFVELDPEVGLREAGLTKERRDRILKLGNPEYIQINRLSYEQLSDIEDGVAFLLATVGRGTSQCKYLCCFGSDKGKRGKALYDSNEASCFGSDKGKRGKALYDSNEASALCANLSSNRIITEIQIGDTSRSREFNLTLLSNALRTNYTLTKINFVKLEMHDGALRNLLLDDPRKSSSWQTVAAKLREDLRREVRKRDPDYVAILKLKTAIANEAEKLQIGGLQVNTTITELDLGGNYFSDQGIEYVAQFLRTNSTVKKLDISRILFGLDGARPLVDALRHNDTLEILRFGHKNLKCDVAECLLEPFSCNVEGDSSHGSYNTTVKKLHVENCSHELALPLARIIETNKTLISLNVESAEFLKEDWTSQIFPALSRNETLERVSLFDTKSLEGDEVGEALMDLIQTSDTSLKQIDFSSTGISHWQGRVDEELRINREYRDKLRNQPMVAAKSGRIVLCGFQLGGKTSIRNTMERVHEDTPSCCPLYDMACKSLMRMLSGLLMRMLSGLQQTSSRTELEQRTRGFDILILDKQAPRMSVWDLAGQREYYALHDYLFPDVKNSCFLYVCGCTSKEGKVTEEKMEEDFMYWMRFIASNSKAPDSRGKIDATRLPSVQFVLTKKDTLTASQLDESYQRAVDVVDRLQKTFRDVIDLSQSVEVINAHADGDVERLLGRTSKNLEQILQIQTEYEVCQVVRSALDKWSRDNSSTPIMTFEKFTEICDGEVKSQARVLHKLAKLDEEEGKKVVLAYLNDMGDVIYPKGLDFIVVKPRWFGIGIMGYLINPIDGPDGFKLHHKKGFVNRKNLERWLERSLRKTAVQENSISVEMLIKLMTKLEICFEAEQDNEDSSLFFPAVFDDENDTASKGLRKLKGWSRAPGTVYVGRRLECLHKSTTVLTPGFFPRLQVHLVNHIRNEDWAHDGALKVDRDLIRFPFDEKEICLEYSEVDSFVDIMVKSSKSFKATLTFLQDFMRIIEGFCASPKGCPGVTLVQAVIRPVCVQKLHLCDARKNQSLQVSELERKINKHGKDFVYNWQQISDERLRGREPLGDRAVDLLEGAPECSSSTSSRGDKRSSDQLPEFFLSIKDVRVWEKLKAAINVSHLEPFKLHLYCDGLGENRGEKHEVRHQPGRDLKLKGKKDGVDFQSLKPIVEVLANKAAGANISGLIEIFFDNASLTTTDFESLVNMIKSDQEDVDPSREDVMQALEDHMEYTGCLKKFLNVDDANFEKDFHLLRVNYADPPGGVRWLCKKHEEEARQKGMLKSHKRECISHTKGPDGLLAEVVRGGHTHKNEVCRVILNGAEGQEHSTLQQSIKIGEG